MLSGIGGGCGQSSCVELRKFVAISGRAGLVGGGAGFFLLAIIANPSGFPARVATDADPKAAIRDCRSEVCIAGFVVSLSAGNVFGVFLFGVILKPGTETPAAPSLLIASWLSRLAACCDSLFLDAAAGDAVASEYEGGGLKGITELFPTTALREGNLGGRGGPGFLTLAAEVTSLCTGDDGIFDCRVGGCVGVADGKAPTRFTGGRGKCAVDKPVVSTTNGPDGGASSSVAFGSAGTGAALGLAGSDCEGLDIVAVGAGDPSAATSSLLR